MPVHMSTAVCTAALNIKGEHFACDNPQPHDGWAHSNRAAEAIWASDVELAERAA